mmetsp:Transcript_47845/g.54207  ORF Transcript_47845/g.54207 Transcript_47845/m.54207 type:complete len:691 (+) Transcript_47845:139-2211(+)
MNKMTSKNLNVMMIISMMLLIVVFSDHAVMTIATTTTTTASRDDVISPTVQGARVLQMSEAALDEYVDVTSTYVEPTDADSNSDSSTSTVTTNSTATAEEKEEDHTDDHSGDCHCDGDVPHCVTASLEASFNCEEEGDTTTTTDCYCTSDNVPRCRDSADEASYSCDEEEKDTDCHCDGDVPHCADPADETSYSCDEKDTTDCHCDGDVPHCADPSHEASYSCNEDVDCHCDGDVPHCSDPSDELSYSCDDEEEEFQMNDDGTKPWGEVVLFSLVINISTLAGVVVVAAMWLVKKVSPNCQTNKATVRLWVEVLIPMFACGALLATTFFILLPESYVIVMSEFTGGDPHAGHNHRRFLSGDDEEEEPKGEAAGTWRWGSSIMGGFWIPVIMHACFPHDHNHGDNHDGHGGDDDHGHDHGHNHNHDQKGTGSDDSTEKSPTTQGIHNSSKLDQSETTMATTAYRTSSLEDSTNDLLKESPLDSELETGGGVVLASASQKKASRASEIVTFIDRDDDNDNYENENDADYIIICGMLRLKNLPLFISMNIGEALHNFTDGVFVGTALLSCGRNMAISIALATILHELPNQLAGWFVMVNQNGINPWIALLLNFLFGLSILLGGLLVFLFDFSQVMIGCVLAIGGGTFIHVAIGELLQNAERNITHGIQMLYAFVAFLVGAIPIGLILINHEHC